MKKRQNITDSQKDIILALGAKNGQTFTELHNNLGMIDKTLFKGLDTLKKVGYVRQKTKRDPWYLQETENKAIIKFKKSQLMDLNLERALIELEESDNPFEIGHILLHSIMLTLSHLTLEQHKVKVSDVDKVRIEEIINFCNKVIKRVFDVLRDKNKDRASKLSESLHLALTPLLNSYNPKMLKPKEKKLADDLKEKISPYVFDTIKKIKSKPH